MITARAVAVAIVARLDADDDLTALLGGRHVYRKGSKRARRIPSVEWMIVSAVASEHTLRVLIQYDMWATSYAGCAAIENRLMAVLHREVSEDVGGLRMWLKYNDSRDHDEDTEDGQVRCSIDFVFTSARI